MLVGNYGGGASSMFRETSEKMVSLLEKSRANQGGEIDIMIDQYKKYKSSYAANIKFNPKLQNLSIYFFK